MLRNQCKPFKKEKKREEGGDLELQNEGGYGLQVVLPHSAYSTKVITQVQK